MTNYFLKNQVFYINSFNRTSGTDSDFFINLDMDRNNTYDRVVLLDASIPKTYYVVQNGYNTFQLTENTSTVTITIPYGNYNRSSFKNVVTTQLNANSPNGYTYAITNQNIQTTQDTGNYFFSVTGNGAVQPIFTFTTNLYEQFGFNANSSNQFVSNSLQSVNITNLQPESTLFIHSDICQNYQDNVLQNIISASNPDYSYIVFQNPNPREYSKVFRTGFSGSFYFKLTDENGTVINLNGVNMVLTIMVYQLNRIDELTRAFIQYSMLKDTQNDFIETSKKIVENEDNPIEDQRLADF